jgi:hypothetical protein
MPKSKLKIDPELEPGEAMEPVDELELSIREFDKRFDAYLDLLLKKEEMTWDEAESEEEH